jgi:hypothetical protein
MANIKIQENIERLLPYLRGFYWDENLYTRYEVIFPKVWKKDDLFSNKLVIKKLFENENAVNLLLGIVEGDDKPIDYFFNEIEKIITINKEYEKKQELLRKKIEELQNVFNNSPLEELENIAFSKKDNKRSYNKEKYKEQVTDSVKKNEDKLNYGELNHPESEINITDVKDSLKNGYQEFNNFQVNNLESYGFNNSDDDEYEVIQDDEFKKIVRYPDGEILEIEKGLNNLSDDKTIFVPDVIKEMERMR